VAAPASRRAGSGRRPIQIDPPAVTSSSFVTALLLGAAVAAALAGAAVLGIAAYSAHTVVRPRRNWRPDDWQPPALAVEAVHFANRAGQRLHGWYVAPGAGRPVALICHGFGTNRYEGQDLLPWLAAAGFGALLFDFQAHGESEGRFTTVGLREVDDVLSAVEYAQARAGPGVPLVGLGFSMGASALILAAARTPAIRALVLDSPFATLLRAVSRSFRVFFRLPPRVFTRPTIWFAERLTGGRIGDVQPVLAIGDLAPRPVLIIQGTDDAIVDPDDSVLLFAAAGEPKSLWRIDGAGHVEARCLAPDEYRRRVLELFAAAAQPLATLPGPAAGEPAALPGTPA
jgi:alpha-beta hydrolase superfamily lysophospholipase